MAMSVHQTKRKGSHPRGLLILIRNDLATSIDQTKRNKGSLLRGLHILSRNLCELSRQLIGRGM
jgi:hypothetical protein